MKKKTQNKVRLGVFILAGAALLMAGIFVIGSRQQMFTCTFHLSGVFKDVAGLRAGNNVRLSGINIGIVESVEIISDTSVKVDMSIEEAVRRFISSDATAGIGSDGLMGNKLVIISPRTQGRGEIQDNNYIATTNPVDMD